MDGTDVLVPTDVEREILRISALCEKVTTEIAQRARAAAEADVAYKLANAKAFLRSDEKTVGGREASSLIVCEDEYRNRRITEAILLGAQEAGRNYRAQLDALRSINANLRYSVGLS